MGLIARPPSALVYGVQGNKAHTGGISFRSPLGNLVKLELCRLGLLRLEELVGGDCAGAAFEFAEGAEAIIKELKGLVELVGGNLMKSFIGKEEGVLCVLKWVGEENTQLVKHLNGPEN